MTKPNRSREENESLELAKDAVNNNEDIPLAYRFPQRLICIILSILKCDHFRRLHVIS